MVLPYKVVMANEDGKLLLTQASHNPLLILLIANVGVAVTQRHLQT